MKLVQVRECDGACCRESPRFPNAAHSDCIYHDTSGGKENAGCMLMRGDAPTPKEGGIAWDGKTTQQMYQATCVDWPQQNSLPIPGDTGNCCWQLIDDGN